MQDRLIRKDGVLGKAVMGALIGVLFTPFAWIAMAQSTTLNTRVAKGRRLYEQAQFAQALEVFRKAEASKNLGRDDLIAVLEGKALVYLATGEEQEFERSLVQLASIHPEHTFAKSAPPEVSVAFDRAVSASPGVLAIEVQRESIFGGELLRGIVKNDLGTLVQELVLYAKAEKTTEWKGGQNMLRLLAPRGRGIEFYAEARGPGGVVLVSLGSENEPKRFEVGAVQAETLRINPTSSSEKPSELLWFGLGVGVAALIAGGIALILDATHSSDETQPSTPAVVLP